MIKKWMIKMIRLYQKYLSPMKRTKCPYIPTCSQYGLKQSKSTVHGKAAFLLCGGY